MKPTKADLQRENAELRDRVKRLEAQVDVLVRVAQSPITPFVPARPFWQIPTYPLTVPQDPIPNWNRITCAAPMMTLANGLTHAFTGTCTTTLPAAGAIAAGCTPYPVFSSVVTMGGSVQ